MSNVITTEIENGLQFKYENMTTPQLADEVEKIFIAEGYKLEFGDKMSGSYGVGNEILRILLGAFVKRFRFNFDIKDEAGVSILNFQKDSLSKFSGGVIGYKKLQKEFEKFAEKFKAL